MTTTQPPPNNQRQDEFEKISDCPKFNVESAELAGFLLQLRNKLTINADRFLNEYSKIYYAASRLEGDALEVILSHTNDAEELTIATTTGFIKILKTSFRNANHQGTAQRALTALRQG